MTTKKPTLARQTFEKVCAIETIAGKENAI